MLFKSYDLMDINLTVLSVESQEGVSFWPLLVSIDPPPFLVNAIVLLRHVCLYVGPNVDLVISASPKLVFC